MKTKKLLSIILALFSMTCVLVSCSQSDNRTSNQDEREYKEDNVYSENIDLNEFSEESFEETVSFAEAESDLRLSEECDKVLASGYDADNNFFELVANETEDYSGTIIEFGVIKNNSWSIEMTKDCPFVAEDGLLVTGGSIYDDSSIFRYIGAGCFSVSSEFEPLRAEAIWNGNNGKSYLSVEYDAAKPIITADSYETIINNDGIVLLKDFSHELKYLDTNTMEVLEIKAIEHSNRGRIVYPYSEGLFAYYVEGNNECTGFYNLEGEKIVDLSEYNIICSSLRTADRRYYNPKLVFKNGMCTFNIFNDQGTEYRITIDKNGNVLDSVEIE